MQHNNYEVGTREVVLVDDHEQIVGQADIFAAHRWPLWRHQAVSVWLFREVNGKLQVLWQERSPRKPIGGGWWGNTICANVAPGESFLECAVRRLREEVGVTGATLQPAYRFEYRAYGNAEFGEHELDQVFVGEWTGEANPNPAEATQVVWLDWEELLEQVAALPRMTPGESLVADDERLEKFAQKCQISMKIQSKNTSIIVNPWTILMLQDHRLHDSRAQLRLLSTR